MNAPIDIPVGAAVQVLRDHADSLARRLKNLPLRPMQRTRMETQLDTVCTCIELLTVNGNYAAERLAAIQRAGGGR